VSLSQASFLSLSSYFAFAYLLSMYALALAAFSLVLLLAPWFVWAVPVVAAPGYAYPVAANYGEGEALLGEPDGT
jgi:hypothetical protein